MIIKYSIFLLHIVMIFSLGAMEQSSISGKAFYLKAKDSNFPVPVKPVYASHFPVPLSIFKDEVYGTLQNPLLMNCKREVIIKFFLMIKECNSFLGPSCIVHSLANKFLTSYSIDNLIKLVKLTHQIGNEAAMKLIGSQIPHRIRRQTDKVILTKYKKLLKKLSPAMREVVLDLKMTHFFIKKNSKFLEFNQSLEQSPRVLHLNKGHLLISHQNEILLIECDQEKDILRGMKIGSNKNKISISASKNAILVHDSKNKYWTSNLQDLKMHLANQASFYPNFQFLDSIKGDLKKNQKVQYCITDSGNYYVKINDSFCIFDKSLNTFTKPWAQYDCLAQGKLWGCSKDGSFVLFKKKNKVISYLVAPNHLLNQIIMKHEKLKEINIIGSVLLTVGKDSVKMWHMGHQIAPVLTIDHKKVCCAALNETDNCIATADTGGVIKLWDIRSNSLIDELELPLDYGIPYRMSFDDGKKGLWIIVKKGIFIVPIIESFDKSCFRKSKSLWGKIHGQVPS